MGTTRQEIREWLEAAKEEENISHVIIVCDTFDYEDYPISVKRGWDIKKVIKQYNMENMQRIMEIYNLDMDMEKQLNEPRAYHPDDFDSSKSSSEEEE